MRSTYFFGVLRRFGIAEKWVKWIQMCIESISYFVLVNQEQAGPISPRRGIRRGDPLSPYLFTPCSNGLTELIKQLGAHGDLNGVSICRGAPKIFHLLFANYCLLFFRASSPEVESIKSSLIVYEQASSQCVNYRKSKIFFSRNVPSREMDDLASWLVLEVCLGTGKYLGLPSMKALLKFIKARV